MIQLENFTEQLQTSKFLDRTWKVENGSGIVFYEPLELPSSQADLIRQTKEKVSLANLRIAQLYNGATVSQQIVLCPNDFYVERFLDKAKRFAFDPQPWVDWSEGDNDILDNIGNVFCIRVGAKFESLGDEERFYAHELGHPNSSIMSPIFNPTSKDLLLADSEGLVEADARIAMGIQTRDDMKFSRDFIASLKDEDLATPAEVGIKGYDHPSFINKTVSLNPGYASCFLWFLGQTVRVGKKEAGEVGIKQHYLSGREKLLDIARRSSTKVAYKELLREELGFDYDKEARSTSFLNETRQLLLSLQ